MCIPTCSHVYISLYVYNNNKEVMKLRETVGVWEELDHDSVASAGSNFGCLAPELGLG